MPASVMASPERGRARWAGGRVSARARCVLADNPSPLTYLGTNTWILSEPGLPGCIVVDPGPASRSHLEALVAACAEDALRVDAVVLTHDHPDHAGGAPAFAQRVGAPLLARRDGTLPDGPVRIGGEAPRIETVPLPGHSSDSVGFVFPADRSFVTGDHLFRQGSTLICWPDGSLSAYMDSLDTVAEIVSSRGIDTLLTAHGLPVEHPLEVVDRQRAHRLARLERVRAVAGETDAWDVEGVLEAVYDDVDRRLDPAARMTIEAQLAYLSEGRGEPGGARTRA